MPRKRQLDFEVLGLDEITAYFSDLGKVPQGSVKKAARAGAVILKRKIPNDVQTPVKYGFLRMSLRIVEEKKRKNSETGKMMRNLTGKAGFHVAFDYRFNSIFQKKVKPGGKGTRGSKNPKDMYYYPASMEYGFATTKGGVGGHHFMRKVGQREESGIQNKMIEVLSKDIDKIQKRKDAGG